MIRPTGVALRACPTFVSLVTCAFLFVLSACVGEDGPALEGRFHRMVAGVPGESARVLYSLDTGRGGIHEVLFDATPALEDGTTVRLRGAFDERARFRASSHELLSPAVETVPRSVLVDATTTPPPRKVAVILFNFQNEPAAQPISVADARERIFNAATSTAAFVKELSYGMVTLEGKARRDGDVLGYFTIPVNSDATCNAPAWGNEAAKIAQGKGIELDGYDHYVFMFPRTAACDWAGLGQLGGRATWINGTSIPVLNHELGHNFRCMHASSYTCKNGSGQRVTMSGSCTASEYGNPFDIMGRANRHTNVYNKTRAGWLGQSQTATVTADGTYTVLAQARPSAGVQALRVRRDDTLYYYVEYRQPFGFDAFKEGDPVVGGVLVFLAPGFGSQRNPLLLDMNPQTESFLDAPLAVGKTYEDPDGRVKISVVARDGEAARVKFELPGGTLDAVDVPAPASAPSMDAGAADAPPLDARGAIDVSTADAISPDTSAADGSSPDVPAREAGVDTAPVDGAGRDGRSAGSPAPAEDARGEDAARAGDGGSDAPGSLDARIAGDGPLPPPPQRHEGGGCATGGRPRSFSIPLSLLFAIAPALRRRRSP